jgi:hypothetical protein
MLYNVEHCITVSSSATVTFTNYFTNNITVLATPNSDNTTFLLEISIYNITTSVFSAVALYKDITSGVTIGRSFY